jgi:hypothetical protein
MNRHLNKEREEYKTGHVKGRALVGGKDKRRGQRRVNIVDVISIHV